MNARKILVAGSANLDFVTRVSHIPVPGETVLGPLFTTAPGGKGANQAVACARVGGQVAFLGALGDDLYAAPLRKSLRESGVQDLTLTVPTSTGAAFISVSQSGENAITVASGANLELRSEHLPDLTPYGFLVLQLEIPLAMVQDYSKKAREAGVTVVLNAAPIRPLPPELLESVDILTVNEGELSGMANEREVEGQLAQVRARGPQTVIVTLGERGCLALSDAGLTEQAGVKVAVQDTTGAGDTFVGALVAALSEGRVLPDALRFATHASALACTRPGAQPAMPTREEVEGVLK